jgi:hypothetical protein
VSAFILECKTLVELQCIYWRTFHVVFLVCANRCISQSNDICRCCVVDGRTLLFGLCFADLETCFADCQLTVFILFFGRFCKPIMTKSRPPPPKPAAAQSEPKPAESKDPNAGTGAAPGAEVHPTPTEPMETEAPAQEPETMQTE